jgi:hypothetical protein
VSGFQCWAGTGSTFLTARLVTLRVDLRGEWLSMLGGDRVHLPDSEVSFLESRSER